MAPTGRRDRHYSFNLDIADDIKIVMDCMKKSHNNINNNICNSMLMKMSPSPIIDYPVCNHTLVVIGDDENQCFNDRTSVTTNYNNRVLYVIVDLYKEDNNNCDFKQCVICKDTYFIPKITKCGHIFCYSCILAYMNACGAGQSVKCPVCSRWIYCAELKSIIWRNLKKIKLGDRIKFHLYRYNIEKHTVERINKKIDKSNSYRRKLSNSSIPSKHSFEYLWNHVVHIGNGHLHINQIDNIEKFILPDTNIYYISKSDNMTLFDIEKSLLVERINDPSISSDEMMSLLACIDHFNEFIREITRCNDTSHEDKAYGTNFNVTGEIVHKNSTNSISSFHYTSSYNIAPNSPLNDNKDFFKHKSYCINNYSEKQNIHVNLPISKPEFIKTPHDLKTTKNSDLLGDYRFKKYLYFYKNETYFNTYMGSINCNQISDYIIENKCIFNNQLRLPLVVEGILLKVENYDPEGANIADPAWLYCSSMIKFLCFCDIQITHPYDIPLISDKSEKSVTKKNNLKVCNENNHKNMQSLSDIDSGEMQIIQDLPCFNPDDISISCMTNNHFDNSYTNSSLKDTFSEVYPDIKSHYYDCFGNKWDDFPSLE